YEVDLVDLTAARRLPADAAVLIAAEPRSPYSREEEEMLRRYLAAGDGRLILFLAPGYRPGLDRLLSDWCITADDDIVRDVGPDHLAEDGDLMIDTFAPNHPVTLGLLHSSFK